MILYPLVSNSFCNLRAILKLSSYSASPLTQPAVPLLTLAFTSDAPGPTGSFSLLPCA